MDMASFVIGYAFGMIVSLVLLLIVIKRKNNA
jgi:hypothetical protein